MYTIIQACLCQNFKEARQECQIPDNLYEANTKKILTLKKIFYCTTLQFNIISVLCKHFSMYKII